MKKELFVLVFLGFFGLIFHARGGEVYVCMAGSLGIPPMSGSPAPDFSLKGLNGENMRLKDFLV